MKMNRILLLTMVALISTASVCAAGDAVYVQTTATSSYTTYIGPIPIPGLQISLPVATKDFNIAIVTLNMPNLFLSQNTSRTIPMAATLQIVAPFAPGGLIIANGGIGCDNVNVNVSGIKPFTMVIKVPLGTVSQPVEAEWASNGTSTVTTQTFASLSAVLVKE
jgi:hypothetical protein